MRFRIKSGQSARRFEMCIRDRLQIDLIGVVDQLLGKLLPDEGGQVAAHLIGEAQLALSLIHIWWQRRPTPAGRVKWYGPADTGCCCCQDPYPRRS